MDRLRSIRDKARRMVGKWQCKVHHTSVRKHEHNGILGDENCRVLQLLCGSLQETPSR